MANYTLSSSGATQVPLGGTAVLNINAKVGGALEDVDSVRVVLKDNLDAVLSDETYSGVDISATATDGGAIAITNPTGTGNYRWTYTVPNDATYDPPPAGQIFCVEVTIDEGGDLGTSSLTFIIVDADVTINFDSTTVSATVKRRAGLLEDILVPGENRGSDNVTLPLRTGIVYSIEAAYKNGALIDDGGVDYAWNTFSPLVTLTAAATDTDFYLFRALTKMRDEVVTDFVEESRDFIMAKLRGFYDDDDLMTLPTVEALVAARAIGYIKEELCEGVALENAKYRSGRELIDETNMILRAICRGEVGLVDASGDIVARKDGSTVGAFIHADGVVSSRIDMVDRAQQWTALFQDLWPETRPSRIVSERTLP